MTDAGPASPTQGAILDWREAVAIGRFGAARQAYVTAGESDEAVRRALGTLADVEASLREKSWSRAEKRLHELEVRPPFLDWEALEADLATLRRSGEALDKRDPDAALEALEAVRGVSFAAEAETQRGTARIFNDDLEGARTCFERALELDPSHYRALTNLGNVELEQGNVDDAIAAYERALKLNDDFANAHHNLGVAYRRKGNVTKSVRSLRRAQRSLQRHDTAEARTRLREMGSKNASKALKWVLYAGVALAAYLLLRSRGML